MSEPMTVICSDTHVQRGAWSDRPIVGDSHYSLEQIIDYAVANDIRHVFGTGDLLDQQINGSSPVHAYISQLARLHDIGGIFDFIQGQHDMQSPPWLTSSPAARHMHKLHIELSNGVLAYGLDYQPAVQLQAELDLIPEGTTLLLAHQVWAEFMGDIAVPQGSMADVPVVSMVVSGDYHVATEKKTKGKDGQTIQLVSPGSTCMQAIDEPVDKRFMVLNDDMTFTSVPLITRRMVELGNIAHPADADHLVAEILPREVQRLLDESAGYDDRIRKPIIRVVYSAAVPEVRRRVMEVCGNRVHLFFKENPPESRDSEVDYVTTHDNEAGHPREAITLATGLAGYLEAKKLERLSGPCRRLLETHDVSGELRRLKEEAIAV